MDDGGGDRDRREIEKASENHQGQSFRTIQSQPQHQKLSSESSGPVYQQNSFAVRGLNIQRAIPAPGQVDASMSAGDAPRERAAMEFFSLSRPRSIPDLYRSSNPSISALDALNANEANTSLEDHSVEQRVAFAKPHAWSRQTSGGSSRSSSGGIECEGGSSSIQPYRPITVPDQLRKSTSSEVAELDMSLPFPAKLHYIISNPKYEEFITWCSHGRAWRVLKQREFEKDVIPIFFRSDKFASFMRQVRTTQNG
jgi:hypothetical protein